MSCSLLLGQTADTLRLSELLSIGLEHNFAIRLVQQEEKIAANNLSRGNAGFLPRVDLNVIHDLSEQNISAQFLTGDKLENPGAGSTSFTAGAQLNWTLFDGLRMFTTYEKLQELQSLGELDSRVMIEQTMADILVAAYDVIQQSRRIAVWEASVALSEARAELADEKFQIGSGSKRETLLAQVDGNADRSELLTQLSLLDAAQSRLNRLLGRSPEQKMVLREGIELREQLVYADLREQALAQNPALLQTRQTQEILRLEQKEIQAERYPVLAANLGYAFNRSTSEAGFLLASQVSGVNYGYTIGFNLFNGMDVSRRLQQAEIQRETANLQLADLQHQLENQLFQAYQAYQNALQRLRLEQENLRVSRQNLEITRQTYELGELSSLEFRESQRNQVASENRLIEVLYQVKLYEVELLRLSGNPLLGE
jgi:outer membrane protein TolC